MWFRTTEDLWPWRVRHLTWHERWTVYRYKRATGFYVPLEEKFAGLKR